MLKIPLSYTEANQTCMLIIIIKSGDIKVVSNKTWTSTSDVLCRAMVFNITFEVIDGLNVVDKD
jgi:hypothetical protein